MSQEKLSKKQLQDKIDELLEDQRRVQADLYNIRRRADEDRVNIGQHAKKQIILSLLPVLDDLERALRNMPQQIENDDFASGLKAISKRLSSALSEHEVTLIMAQGQEFDPHSMEAVAVSGEGDHEIVSEVLQNGYMMGGEVLRPAIVKVEKTRSKT